MFFNPANNYETEPTEHTHPDGPSYLKATISIAEYLRSEDVFGGPITDNELSESDGEMDDLSWLESGSDPEGTDTENVPRPSFPKTRSEKQKEQHKRWTQKKRQAAQEAAKTDLKAVIRKRLAESCQDAVQSGYCLENDAFVSAPGWTGLLLPLHKPIRDQDNPIREQAKKDGLTYFPWDGR